MLCTSNNHKVCCSKRFGETKCSVEIWRAVLQQPKWCGTSQENRGFFSFARASRHALAARRPGRESDDICETRGKMRQCRPIREEGAASDVHWQREDYRTTEEDAVPQFYGRMRRRRISLPLTVSRPRVTPETAGRWGYRRSRLVSAVHHEGLSLKPNQNRRGRETSRAVRCRVVGKLNYKH
ncbi:hypothetical protein MRX96_028407 [Rhipicephalus microplus]